MVDAETAGPVTLKAARWAAELTFDAIPADVVAFAKHSILDGIGCAIRGLDMEAGRLILAYAFDTDDGARQATIWGAGKKRDARLAGLVNGTAAHVPNIGDSFNAHPVHLNYLLPQAAIATAEREGRGGREVIAAFVAGAELVTRATLATDLGGAGGYFDPEGRGWQCTGAVGGIGTSVAAAKILGLPVDGMVQALVLGGTQIGGVYRPCGAHMGKSLFAGKAVEAGIENAYVAKTGFVAGYRLYEDGLCFGSGILSPDYDLDAAAAGLGGAWQSLNVDFCIHPAKKIHNANLDALLEVLCAENLAFDDIARIDVLSAYARAHAQDRFARPANSSQAFNNIRYIVAAAAHDGDYGFAQLEPDKFANPEILAFAENNVAVVPDPELEALVGKSWPGGIRIATKDGRVLTNRFKAHKGEIHNPLSTREIQDKFRRMAADYDADKIEPIIRTVDRLEDVRDIGELTRLL